jgi:voltage-gated potassium channel Kch
MNNPLNKFKWKTDGRLFGFGTSPEADWKIIFISTLVLGSLVIALSVYMFIEVGNREISELEELAGQDDKPLNASLLRDTVLYYQNKALKFERIKNQ